MGDITFHGISLYEFGYGMDWFMSLIDIAPDSCFKLFTLGVLSNWYKSLWVNIKSRLDKFVYWSSCSACVVCDSYCCGYPPVQLMFE